MDRGPNHYLEKQDAAAVSEETTAASVTARSADQLDTFSSSLTLCDFAPQPTWASARIRSTMCG